MLNTILGFVAKIRMFYNHQVMTSKICFVNVHKANILKGAEVISRGTYSSKTIFITRRRRGAASRRLDLLTVRCKKEVFRYKKKNWKWNIQNMRTQNYQMGKKCKNVFLLQKYKKIPYPCIFTL